MSQNEDSLTQAKNVPADALEPNGQRLRPQYIIWLKVKVWYFSESVPNSVSAGCARMLKDLRGQKTNVVCTKLRRHARIMDSRSGRRTYRYAALIIEQGWTEWPGLAEFNTANRVRGS